MAWCLVLHATFFGAFSHREMIRLNYYFSWNPLLGKINFILYSRLLISTKKRMLWFETSFWLVLQTCDEEANYNLLAIFWSEGTKLKYTLNLVRCFLLHSTKFQYLFMDLTVNYQIHMINDMFKNILKQYFMKECFSSERNLLHVRFYRLAVLGVGSSHA